MTESAKKVTTPKKPRTTASKTVAPTGIAAKTAAPKKSATPKVTRLAATHEQIALLAHRFWNERGRQHGRHEEDWLRAEQELLGKAS